jgi:hypothetical protein
MQGAPATTRTATCTCGSVSVACEGEPAKVSLCHCLACQKRTGSTYGIGAFFPDAALTLCGETSSYTRPSDSGHAVTFHFCPNCGSTVWWQASRLPGMTAVAVGAFADPQFPAPQQAVFKVHKHGWVVVPE